MKRLAVVCAVLGLVGLVLGMVVPAGAQDGGGRTIRVVERITEARFQDLAPQGPSLGDQFVQSGNLWRQGNRVGRDGVVCTVTSRRREELQCEATVRFHNGQIAVQGLISNQSQFDLPVTGGSGAYTGAEGIVHVNSVSNNKEILTFHLED